MNRVNYEEAPKWQIREGDQIIAVIGAETILIDLYLEGWSPDDEGFERVLLDALREAGNHLSSGQEHIVVHALVDRFHRYCR
jgi:hypothetical protein